MPLLLMGTVSSSISHFAKANLFFIKMSVKSFTFNPVKPSVSHLIHVLSL